MSAEPVTTDGDAAKHAQKLASLAAYRRLKELVAQWQREERVKKKVALATLVGIGFLAIAVLLISGVIALMRVLGPTGAVVVSGAGNVVMFEGFTTGGSRKRTTLVTPPETVVSYKQRLLNELQSRADANLVTHTRSLNASSLVQINVYVSRTGSIYNVTLKRSSGNDYLDHVALTLMKQGEQFEALPSGLPGDLLGVVVSLNFHPARSTIEASNSGMQQTPTSGAADPRR